MRHNDATEKYCHNTWNSMKYDLETQIQVYKREYYKVFIKPESLSPSARPYGA